ncbi:hypothetical protein AUC45_04010 [Erythrobacter sp. YT30]|nr:hypothetical protein AUC45_04010 [Erythrobacter sp. YT30]
MHLAGVLTLSQAMTPIDEVSSELSALEALNLCEAVVSDFSTARQFLESKGWEHKPPSDYIAENWKIDTAGWYKNGFSLIAFHSKHGTKNEAGDRSGSCLAEFRGDSNIAATEIAAYTGISASQYEESGKNTLHRFQFQNIENTIFLSNRADRENPRKLLGIMTLAVEPKSSSIAQ